MIPLQIVFQRSVKSAFYAGFKYYSTASLLSALRKKTGFSVANCRKALDLHGNDVDKAEAWLNSQAQSNGWEKAVKLQNRVTQNGLIGIVSNGNVGVMVNCETDFVSRNQTFRELVTFCTNTLYSTCLVQSSATDENKVTFNSDQLTRLETSSDDSKSLADYLAFNIGKIGENILIRRGVALYSRSLFQKVAAGIHPKATDDSVALGKYGSLILIEEKGLPTESAKDIELDVSDFSRLLCQHVIGMNPRIIKSSEGENATTAEEDILYQQEFVANPAYSVGELVEKLNYEVHHFVRYECGEQS